MRVKADGGFDGMRIPLLDPTDRHGVWNPQLVRLFDSDAHTMNAIGLYMRTRGKTFDLDPDCACSAAALPRYFLDGVEKLYTADPTCANDAQKTRVNLCNAACVATLDLYTAPEVRCP
jgi:hypothetical protein